jgi:hypothetical protein
VDPVAPGSPPGTPVAAALPGQAASTPLAARPEGEDQKLHQNLPRGMELINPAATYLADLAAKSPVAPRKRSAGKHQPSALPLYFRSHPVLRRL